MNSSTPAAAVAVAAQQQQGKHRGLRLRAAMPTEESRAKGNLVLSI